MRSAIVIVCCCLVGFFLFSKPSKATRKIAVVVRPNYLGEYAYAKRIQSACEHLGWKADLFENDPFKRLKKHPYDFAIYLTPDHCKFRNAKYYLSIFDPIHHYFLEDGTLSKHYRHYDGYLLTYSPQPQDKNFSIEKKPYLKWYPTVQARAYKEVKPNALFYIVCTWGDRIEDPRMQHFFSLLGKAPFARIYGSPLMQDYLQNYCGAIPFDNDSIYELANQSGVALILHSSDHRKFGLPSGRIFEAAAASCVIICDENAFVRDYFGDSVLYINTEESGEGIYNQVKQHMEWIQNNHQAALEKARRAHAVYQEHFLLEEQLLRLSDFHDELSHNAFYKWVAKKLKRVSAVRSLFNPTLVASTLNQDPRYSLVNSVDFHPQEEIFCVTYTHNNKVSLYEIGTDHKPRHRQTLSNPDAKLSEPQHAVFSPSGDKLVVANWTNETLNVYPRTGQHYSEEPIACIAPPTSLQTCKPHGIAFSPSGTHLAIAYGAADYHPRGIALFRSEGIHFQHTSLLTDLPGIPKGITFTPDGTHLLVTFGSPSSLAIFSIHNETIDPSTRQCIRDTISRPEDVKIAPNGSYCAVTNSDQNRVTFYHFDKNANAITQETPFFTLKNPQAQLSFPHGLAFSRDGTYLAITQFGKVCITDQGNISWKSNTPAQEGKTHLYLIK